MTKRALSLLLTLVMVLSLCVPALAAEAFETEAPAEVEAAPVDPVANDAPEAASISEAVDVPQAIYQVEVSDTALKKLNDAIAAAEADVAAVKAHTKMTLGSNVADTIIRIMAQLAETGKDDLITKYEAAVELRDQINGSGANLTDADVDSKVTALLAAREALKSETTQGLYTSQIQEIVKLYKATEAADGDTLIGTFGGTNEWFDDDNSHVTGKTNLEVLKMVRRADYVNKLVAAVAAAEATAEDVTGGAKIPVKQLWDAVEGLWNLRYGGKEEVAAKTPTAPEAAELYALYKDANDKVKDNVNYGGQGQFVTTRKTDGSTDATKRVWEAVNEVGALFDQTGHTNDFKTDKSYWDYKVGMENIKAAAKKLQKIDVLVSLDSYAVQNGQKAIDIFLKYDDSDETKTDTHSYVVTWQDNLQEHEVDGYGVGDKNTWSTMTVKTGNEVKIDGAYNKDDNAAKNKGEKLKSTDTVTFRLYVLGVDGAKTLVGQPLVVTGVDKDYDGPLFRGNASFKASDGSISGSLTQDITSSTAPNVRAYEIALTAEGKTAQKLVQASAGTNPSDSSVASGGLSYTFGATTVDKVVTNAGNYTLTLKVRLNDESGLISRGTTTVTVPALEKYQNKTPISAPVTNTVAKVSAMAGTSGGSIKGVNDLQTFVTAVKGLDTNLVLDKNTDTAYVEDLASAKQLLADAVTAAEKVITDAATLANTQTNQKKVTTAATDIQKILGYLTEGADTTAFDTALAAAKALVKSDYTTASWLASGIEAAIKAADAAVKAVDKYGFADTAANRQNLKKLTKDLNDAMKKLVAVGADKAALNAAIAAAEALKAEDYTEASWKDAALADAIAAAKLVAAKDNAGKTEIDAAKAALDAAVAKLVKVTPEEPEGPKAPASGTGWVLYDGTWYFFKAGKLVSNYWVGKIDGASQWDSNWYYVGADGKMLTGMQYLDDLHGGMGWYFLQPTNTKGEIGKMLTGWQWVGGQYGECYFSKANGSSGKCTWSELMGNWNTSTNSWSK